MAWSAAAMILRGLRHAKRKAPSNGRVNIHIGQPVSDGDVLYLHIGAPQAGECDDTPEGHELRFASGTHRSSA